VDRPHAVDVTAYGVAVGLASVAALFSIRGMVTLFPGAPVLIIAMATMMESAKLVTAGWLARRWRATAWVWRLVLVVLVAGLALINAAGVYAGLDEITYDSTCTCGAPHSPSRPLRGGRIIRKPDAPSALDAKMSRRLPSASQSDQTIMPTAPATTNSTR